MELTELGLQLQEFVVYLWSQPEVKFLVGSVFVNLIVAIAASVHLGEFKLYKTAEFLYKKLLPYTLIYAATRLVADWVEVGWLSAAAFAAIEASLLADLLENVAAVGLKHGVELPEGLFKSIIKD